MNTRDLWIYRVVTGVFSLMILMGAGMYFMQHAVVQEAFTTVGYPTNLIYPLAVVKILGVVGLWQKKSAVLKEWAYAGFFYVLVLGTMAHATTDGGYVPALLALVLLLVSYGYSKKVSGKQPTPMQ